MLSCSIEGLDFLQLLCRKGASPGMDTFRRINDGSIFSGAFFLMRRELIKTLVLPIVWGYFPWRRLDDSS